MKGYGITQNHKLFLALCLRLEQFFYWPIISGMPTHVPVETTPENVLAIAAELRRCGEELQGAAMAMQDGKFERLDVVNFGVLKKAVFGANSYVKAVKDAIWNAKEERGDFGTGKLNGRANGVKKAKK